MTKIRKVFLLLSAFFVFAIAASAICFPITYAYAESETEETTQNKTSADWEEWFNEKLVPSIILVITGVSAIYITISPILVKVKKASDKFRQATDEVNKTAKSGDENAEKIASFTNEVGVKLEETANAFIDKVKALDERISRIEQSSQNTEEIARIGFCNIKELVNNGYAAEIEKVGRSDEQIEETTES